MEGAKEVCTEDGWMERGREEGSLNERMGGWREEGRGGWLEEGWTDGWVNGELVDGEERSGVGGRKGGKDA